MIIMAGIIFRKYNKNDFDWWRPGQASSFFGEKVEKKRGLVFIKACYVRDFLFVEFFNPKYITEK